MARAGSSKSSSQSDRDRHEPLGAASAPKDHREKQMTQADRVELVVPAREEYARTVRMTAAELATRAGMDIDAVDDVRMAVEEAFVFAVARVAGDALTFSFTVAPGTIELSVGPLLDSAGDDEGPDRSERYARFILESICDEFEILRHGGMCTARLVKKTG